MASALHTVEASGFGRFMREALYAYPAAEALHIVGLALLFGSIALVDLRLLGVGRPVPLKALVRFAVPLSLVGFAIAATAGAAMFTAHAEEFITQPVFLTKMALIVAGGVNAALLHAGALREPAWDASDRAPARVRAAAVLSLAVWLSVIVCGRLLAYL